MKRLSFSGRIRFFLLLLLVAGLWLAPSWLHAQAEVREGRLYFGKEEVEFVQLTKIVAEFCKVNIVLPDNAKGGKLFVLTPDGMDPKEAWATYVRMLELMEVTFSPTGLYAKYDTTKNIEQLPSKIFIQKVPAFDASQPQVTLLYKLRSLEPDEAKKILDALRSNSGKVFIAGDMLLIVELQPNLPRLIRILEDLDVGAPDTKIYFWTAQNSPIEDIVKIAEELFMKGGKGKDTAVGLEKFVTDERTNGLFVVGTEEACKRVLAFIPKLDTSINRLSEMDVIFLRFAEAENVNSTLQQIVTKTATKKTKRREFGEDLEVKTTADKENNAIIVTGPPRGIREIKRLVAQLDRFPRQVFLEAVIMEVGVSDDIDTGFSVTGAKKIDSLDGSMVAVGTNYGSLSSAAISPSTLMGLAVGVRGESVKDAESMGLGADFPSFAALLRLLQTSSKVNLLSNPYLIGMDAEEAEIIVGSNVPFITGASMDSYNQPVLSIQRQDVALTMKLKPEINEKGRVKLKVEITIENLSSISEVLGPTTTKRSIKTVASTGDGERLAIGGLLKDSEIEDKEKVPVLSDIPIIGLLFRNTGNRTTKNNLLVVLTPHIIDSPEDLKKIFKNKLKERTKYIKEFYGEEYTGYDLPEEFHDRVGLAEEIRQIIAEQKREASLESEDQVIVVTPDSVQAVPTEDVDEASGGFETRKGIRVSPDVPPESERSEKDIGKPESAAEDEPSDDEESPESLQRPPVPDEPARPENFPEGVPIPPGTPPPAPAEP